MKFSIFNQFFKPSRLLVAGFLLARKNYQSGFTLLEILISIFIVGLMTSVVIVNYRSSGYRVEINNATEQLASNIRLAQNFSLGTREFNGANPKAWGVRFAIGDLNHYIIFADMDGNNSYSADENYKTINLPNGVAFSNLGGATNEVSIIFIPPDPITKILIDGVNQDNINIALQESFNNSIKEVSVNFLGLIDVKQ